MCGCREGWLVRSPCKNTENMHQTFLILGSLKYSSEPIPRKYSESAHATKHCFGSGSIFIRLLNKYLSDLWAMC